MSLNKSLKMAALNRFLGQEQGKENRRGKIGMSTEFGSLSHCEARTLAVWPFPLSIPDQPVGFTPTCWGCNRRSADAFLSVCVCTESQPPDTLTFNPTQPAQINPQIHYPHTLRLSVAQTKGIVTVLCTILNNLGPPIHSVWWSSMSSLFLSIYIFLSC